MPSIPSTDDVAPWIERLARVGFIAKGVLYATVGALAVQAALGAGGGTTDTRGAMGTVVEAPFGRALLVVVALGLAGYAAWRLVAAIADPERRGTDAKGLAVRAGYLGRGLVHVALAMSALRAAAGHSPGGGGQQQQRLTARALDAPGGEWIVWLAAIVLGAYGLYQIYRAFAMKLNKQLDLARMSAEAGRWVIGVSRFGIAARGVVFGAIALLLARAASRSAPGEAGGIADALRELSRLGRWPFLGVALGLVAYGVYEALNARYRRVVVQQRAA